MALPIDQKEYLKRYLSTDNEEQNKKKRRRKVKTSVKVTRTFTIVDDDVDFQTLAPVADKHDEINNPLMDDEVPLVAGVIDERPKDEIILEQYRTSNKWKMLGEDGHTRKQKNLSLELTRRKPRHDSTDSDLSPLRKSSPGSVSHKRNVDSDVSPPRQRRGAEEASDSDLSSARKDPGRQNRNRGDRSSSRPQRHDSDSDVSLSGKGQEEKGDRSHKKDQDRRGDRRSNRPLRHKKYHSGSYLSPLRGRHDNRTRNTKGDRPHVRQTRHDSDSDLSPPRLARDDRVERRSDKTQSRRSRHDSDSNLSPPRRDTKRRGPTMNRGTKQGSDSDLSPPRRNNKGEVRSCRRSPPRRVRHDSDSDLSPVRTASKSRSPATNLGTRRGSDSDLSPPRRNKRDGKTSCRVRHDSDSDLSPLRKGNVRHGNRSNRSPTSSIGHNSTYNSDALPSGSKRRDDSDSDLSPVRKTAPQKGRQNPRMELSPGEDRTKIGARSEKGGSKHPRKTLSGTTAGLSDAKTMRRENEYSRRRDTDMYSNMVDELSGKNAKTIFRDKTGRTRDLESEKRKKREDEAKTSHEDQKFVEWGKGVAQTTQQKSVIQDALHEMSKPLARYRDDQDLDDMLKGAEREGDPMMAFLKKKHSKKQAATGVKALPKYKGPPPPPNRFNIMPGYRWDGVDRSSGFEKKFFMRQADKKAVKEAAYKWSTEDM